MTARYPLFLNLSDQRCVVIGGGPVAARKVAGLIEAGGRVTVIAPELHSDLHTRMPHPNIQWMEREATDDDVRTATLVFLATSDSEVNARLERAARAAGVWVNRADAPDGGTFQVPATFRRGDITVAISTGGKSPAFARLLREELESRVTNDDVQLLEVVAEARENVRARSGSAGWRTAIDEETRLLSQTGHHAKAVERLTRRLRAAADVGAP